MPTTVNKLILAVTLVLTCAAPAFPLTEVVKTIKPITSISVTPTVAGYLFAPSQSLDPAPLYGLKLSYDHIGGSIVDTLGIEATVNYFSTTVKSTSQKADGFLVRGDAIYSVTPRKKVVPFLALGGGGIFITKDTTHTNSPFINYGLGVKYFLEDYLALRFDARQLFVYSNVATKSNFELGAGITYYFGKERKKKLPPPAKPALPKKAIPDIVDTESLAPVQPEAAPDLTILDKLGALGPAVVGLPAAPAPFPQAPPALPTKARPLAFKPALPAVGAPAATQQAPPAAEPVQVPQARPEAVAPPAPIAAPAAAPEGAEPAAAPAEPAVAPEQPAAPAGPKQAPTPAAQPAVPEAPAAADQKPAGRTVRYLTVEFEFSSATVQPKYNKQLAALATLINAAPQSIVRVEGHTDSIGKLKANQQLSLRRALNVKEQLVRYGVDPRRIATKGYAYSKPAASNTTSAGRQRNRRAVAIASVIIIE